MATAWMIRNDGTAFPCVCHTYGGQNADSIEETLAAAQWLYEHTGKAPTRALCMELICTWGAQCPGGDKDIVRRIYAAIDSRPYRFLSREFIAAHAGEFRPSQGERTLEDMNTEVNLELNQEFLRARYGGLYDTDPASREMFFRISSTAFDWYPVLYNFTARADFPIDSVTIVRDAEGAHGENRPYRALSGRGVYQRYPLRAFLAERDDPAAAGKGLAVPVSGAADSVTKRIVSGLAAGRSLGELRELPINWERLKWKVQARSMRELALTGERDGAARPGLD